MCLHIYTQIPSVNKSKVNYTWLYWHFLTLSIKTKQNKTQSWFRSAKTKDDHTVITNELFLKVMTHLTVTSGCFSFNWKAINLSCNQCSSVSSVITIADGSSVAVSAQQRSEFGPADVCEVRELLLLWKPLSQCHHSKWWWVVWRTGLIKGSMWTVLPGKSLRPPHMWCVTKHTFLHAETDKP